MRIPRTPQQVVIERRHQVEGGDPLGLDQAERALRLEARLADEGAAHRRHGEQRAHTHGVIERHDAERALAGAIAVLRDVGQRSRTLGAMSPRYALAAPGGARGVEHEREVVFAGTGRGFGRRRQQVSEWHRALGRGAGPDAAEPRGSGGVGHGRSGGLVEGQRRGAGIREEVIQLPALLRQLRGTTTMPASWQAQWSAAISQRFCMMTARRSPGLSPSVPMPPATRETVSSHAP